MRRIIVSSKEELGPGDPAFENMAGLAALYCARAECEAAGDEAGSEAHSSAIRIVFAKLDPDEVMPLLSLSLQMLARVVLSQRRSLEEHGIAGPEEGP